MNADRLTVADANRWIVFCKLIIGHHPGRVVIKQNSHEPIIAVKWSTFGIAFTILHIACGIVGMVFVMNMKVREIRSFTLMDSDLNWVQGIIVTALNICNMYVLFIRLFWHRSCVHDRISLLLEMERQFANVGITVKLQRHRTYIRSILWAIGFVAFNMFHLSYSIFIIALTDLPWAILMLAVTVAIMPAVYKQSALLFYLYDLAETQRFFIQLNKVLSDVLEAERKRAASTTQNCIYTLEKCEFSP